MCTAAIELSRRWSWWTLPRCQRVTAGSCWSTSPAGQGSTCSPRRSVGGPWDGCCQVAARVTRHKESAHGLAAWALSALRLGVVKRGTVNTGEVLGPSSRIRGSRDKHPALFGSPRVVLGAVPMPQPSKAAVGKSALASPTMRLRSERTCLDRPAQRRATQSMP